MKYFSTTLPKKGNPQNDLKFQLLSNFSWLSAGSAVKTLLRFIASLYLARVLSPLGFGQIAFAQAILAYFILIVDSGLQTFGIREVAAASEDKEQIVGKILPTRFALAISSVIILLIFAPLFTPSIETKNLLIVFSVALIPEAVNLAWFFIGLEKMMIFGTSELLTYGVYLTLILLLVRRPEQIVLVPILLVGGYMASALYLSGIYIFRWRLPRLCISIKDNWKLLRSAVPMVTILFFLQIYYNLDTLMLGFYRGETEVGLYNAAYRIIMGIIMLNNVLMYSVYPTFSKLFRVQPSEVSKLLQKTLSSSMVFSIPIAIGGTILSRSIMVTLFGSAFADGGLALQLLVWSAMAALLAANYGFCLVACHQQKALAISVGIGTATNIVLNFLLIPSQGILGACVATIIAQAVMLILQITVFARHVFPTFPSVINILKALCAGLVMGFVLVYFHSALNFFVLLVIGGAAYLSILWLLGGLPLHVLSLFRRQ